MGARLAPALLLALAGWAYGQASPAVQPLAVTQAAPGVYLHEGRVEDWEPGNAGDVANLGFIVGSRCVAVVDSGGTPAIGERLRAAVSRATPLPVCYVINTHAHPDHILGNSAFASADPAAPRFVGHAKLAGALAARGRYLVNALQRDFGIAAAVVPPTLAVDKRLELDLGGRVLQLDAWPTAHTDHDLTVYDRSSRTLFASDLLFVGHMPVVDGSLRGWLQVMQALKAYDVALAVPGHGAPSRSWPGVMDAQHTYLDTLLRETRSAIKRKLTIQQAVDEVARQAAASWQLADRFHRRNVTAAYAELEWEE